MSGQAPENDAAIAEAGAHISDAERMIATGGTVAAYTVRGLIAAVRAQADLLVIERHETSLVREARGEAMAEVEHWKAHAEEAGRGFSQVCKDYARVSARNVALVEGIEAWAEDHFGYLPPAVAALTRVVPPGESQS